MVSNLKIIYLQAAAVTLSTQQRDPNSLWFYLLKFSMSPSEVRIKTEHFDNGKSTCGRIYWHLYILRYRCTHLLLGILTYLVVLHSTVVWRGKTEKERKQNLKQVYIYGRISNTWTTSNKWVIKEKQIICGLCIKGNVFHIPRQL